MDAAATRGQVWRRAVAAAGFAVFLVLACLPAILHLQAGSSTLLSGEKRFATAMPQWDRTKGWAGFVRGVEGYLQDNFGLRNWLLTHYHWLRYSTFRQYHTGSAKVLAGRDGWLFYDMAAQVDAGRGRWLASEQHRRRLREQVAGEHREAQRRGIPYLLVIAPNKNSVFPEMLPSWLRQGEHPSMTDQLLEDLRRHHPEIAVVDLRPAMRQLKDRPGLYLRTDVHWSQRAGPTASRAVADAARRLVPGVSGVPGDEAFRVREYRTAGGDLAARLNIRDRLSDTDYALEPLGPVATSEDKASPWLALPRQSPDHPTFVYRGPDRAGPRVTVFRDSFMTALLPFLPAAFGETIVLWRPFDAAFLDATKPDLVINEMLEMRLYPQP